MPAANPLSSIQPGGGFTQSTAQGSPADRADSQLTGVSASASGGNVNIHVGVLILAALGVIVGLHLLGFRFAVDAGVSSR